ncbi:MAG: hypothetical protein Q9216_007018 [Gyalolechia sp. 2 TL-2023]
MASQASYEELAAALREVNLLREIERSERDEQIARVEQERDRIRRERDQAELERDQAQQLTREMTLHELLETCHHDLFSQLKVQDDPALATRGSHTSVKGKRYPRFLKPWSEFTAKQKRVYDRIYDVWNPQTGAIRGLLSLQGIIDKRKNLDGLVSSEEDLKRFHYQVVEEYAKAILNAMVTNDQLKHNFGRFGGGFHFQNQVFQKQMVAAGQPEVEERRQQLAQDEIKAEPMDKGKKAEALLPSTPKNKSRAAKSSLAGASKECDSDVPPLNADQYLMAWADNQAKLILIEEFKAPHKLTQQFLVLGLTSPKTGKLGSLDVKKVKDRQRSGDTEEQKAQFDAQLLVAAAATQTYAYMLPAGLAYGCIVTGEAFVFLHINEAEPNILRYHVTIPSKDVMSSDGSTIDLAYTAIAQLVTFAVLASESEQYDKKWRSKAMENALPWEVDYAAVERKLQTPRDQRRNLPSPEQFSEWKGRIGSFEPKSHKTRSKRRRDQEDDDDDDPSNDHNGGSDENSSESSDAFVEDDTPSKSSRNQGPKGNEQSSTRGTSRSQAPHHNAYCTQACLFGLVRRSVVDEECPNAALHPRKESDPSLHLIDRKTFRTLVQNQLSETLDDYITDLQIGGARGMLFQITLASHGYVFVSKGTVDVFVSDLKHEGRIYQRLNSLQGTYIPVYLGNIDLVELKWYDYCLCVVHMMLLSHAGERIFRLDDAMGMQVKSFENKLARFGVQHGDLREANMLWNTELQRLFFIDFERSTLLPPKKKGTTTKRLQSTTTQPSPSRALQEISTNIQKSPSKKPDHKSPDLGPLTNSISAPLSGKRTKASATFSIFDDENMSLELPNPSPKRRLSSPMPMSLPKRLSNNVHWLDLAS